MDCCFGRIARDADCGFAQPNLRPRTIENHAVTVRRLRPGWSIAVIRRKKFPWAFAFALAVGLACCVQPASAQSNIGKAAAIKNDVHGVRGSATRTLAAGGSVFSDDEVKTGDASLAQLLFLDQTTFTVAANSQAVLKQVYHPKQRLTQLVMSTVTGAFRFVSGVQGPQHYEVRFPQGYLTVRGTIVDFLVSPTRTIIVLSEGAATVVPYATRVAHDLDTPGTAMAVYNDGHVDGPMTWDRTIIKINGSLPFPLFGNTIWPTQPQAEEADSRKDLNDILQFLPRPGGNFGGSCCL
jgi:hypothetical protein